MQRFVHQVTLRPLTLWVNVISPEAEKGERNSSGHTCCLLTWADLTDIITAFSYGVDGLLLPRSQQTRFGMLLPSHRFSNPLAPWHSAPAVSLN